MKKIYWEIIGIVVISSLIGIVYNFVSEKPLPLIPKVENPFFVSDSTLFEEIQTKDTIKIKKDTSKIIIKETNQKADTNKIKLNKINSDNLKNKDTSKSNIKKEDNKDKKIFRIVTYNQVTKLLGHPNVTFIDARNHDEYEKAHIGNALNIYPYDQPDDYFGKINNMPREKTYVVYCDGGTCDLSHTVIITMSDFGFTHVFLYQGGWDEWIKKHVIQ